MKNFKNKLMVVGVGILSTFMVACGSDSASNSEAKSFEKEKVEEIVIKTDGQNINVRSSNDEKVKVSMNSDKKIPAKLEGKVLTVDMGKSSSGINFRTKTMSVDIPNDMFKKITLMTTSGKISGEKIKSEQLIFSADSGNVDINGFEGKKIEGEIVAGNIKLEEIAGDFTLTNDTGNIDITHNGSFESDSSITTQSGKVDMKLDSKPTSLHVDVSSESGNIKTSLFSSEDITTKGAGSKLNSEIGSGGPTLTIKASSGNISLD